MNTKKIGGIAALSLGAAIIGAGTANATGPDFILFPEPRDTYREGENLTFDVVKPDSSPLEDGWTVSYLYEDDGVTSDCYAMLSEYDEMKHYSDVIKRAGLTCTFTVIVDDGTIDSRQTFTIQSVEISASDVTIDQNTINLVAGKNGEINLTFNNDLTTDDIIIVASTEYIAVTKNGSKITIHAKKATPTGAPETIIIKDNTTGTLTFDTISVTVTPIAPEMTKRNLGINVNETVDITTALTFPTGVRDDAKDITFTLNDPADASKASIEADGKTLKGLAAGTVTIKATLFDGSELTFDVEITPVPTVTDFTVSDVTISVNENKVIVLGVIPAGLTLDFDDITVTDVDNDSVVSFLKNASGLTVKGLKAGIAKLKIALQLADGSSVDHDITITVEEPVTPPTPGQGGGAGNNLPQNPGTGDDILDVIICAIASFCGLVASVFVIKKD